MSTIVEISVLREGRVNCEIGGEKGSQVKECSLQCCITETKLLY